MDFPQKGQRMPETREQFERMARLYEAAMIGKDAQISKLKMRVNKLEQKLRKKNG